MIPRFRSRNFGGMLPVGDAYAKHPVGVGDAYAYAKETDAENFLWRRGRSLPRRRTPNFSSRAMREPAFGTGQTSPQASRPDYTLDDRNVASGELCCTTHRAVWR